MPSERERLGAAMTELCAERGYRQVTPPLLCERAGVKEEALDRHFDGLEDCLRTVVEAGVEELLDRVGKAFLAQQGWRDQLRAVAYELLAFLQDDPARARVMMIETLNAGPEVRAVRDRGMVALIELIDQGRREARDPDAVSRATAEGIATTIYARMHAGIEADGLADGEALVPELMSLAVLPYLGPDAAEAELSMPAPPR